MQYNLQNQHKTFPNTMYDTFTYLLNMHQKVFGKGMASSVMLKYKTELQQT